VLGGLHDRNVYTLLDGGGTGQIRLGSLFNTTAVNAANDTISFTSGHGYRSGDCIWYDPRGGASIIGGGEPANSGGCSSNSPPTPGAQAFFVRVIDATTIALTTTQAAALAGTDAPTLITPIDDTHVKVSSDSNIAVGDRVVYRAPVSVPFTSGFVNVTLTQRDVGGTVITLPATNADGSTAHDPSASNIFVGSTFYDQLNTGDALTYTLRDGTGGMGLTSGTTYYVIKTGDGYTIRLASSHCEAVGPADPTCAPDVIALQLREDIVWQLTSGSFLAAVLHALGRFMVGMAVARQGYLRNPGAHLRGAAILAGITLPLGFLLEHDWAVMGVVRRLGWSPQPLATEIFEHLSDSIGVVCMTAGYVALFVVLWNFSLSRRVLSVFAPTGRMALTNYLSHSAINYLLFFGVGVALIGRVGVAACFALATAVYVGQIVLSRWWLSRWNYGPFEWLWRWWTHGARPRLTRAVA
jgi:hypothetical protein